MEARQVVDPARERRALDAFDLAVDWPEDTRDSQLAALLADDPDLLAIVQGLLAAERDADLMPTRPPEPSAAAANAPPPERVGAYRTADLIGRGGMGSVYRGERIEGGFEQTVAIKLIRSGLFTEAAAEQFAQERQLLARLHHPHITQLYDGGRTADGQSYIVMEMVQGEPILDYVQSRSLGLAARLRLFVEVCSAIDYAHGQGVIHADIKPSNIIIDPNHGAKLLDFGAAGLVGAAGLAAGVRGSTPRFASPQQLAHAPASTADDIFSLGVLLQVLAGDQPGFDNELAAVAARARAPEPEGRYAAVTDMIHDIERWGRIEPVTALPALRRRAVWFFWRRNRLAVSLTALATTCLIVAIAVMTALYVRAEVARRQSDQRFQEVRALSRYMLSDLTGALEQFPGTAPLRSDLAHRGRRYLEGLSQIPGAPADVRLEVAQGYAKTGDILAHLGSQHAGDPAAGKADLAKAETGLRQLMAETGNQDDVALALAGTLVARSSIALNADNQSKRAAALLEEGCALAGSVMRHRPRSPQARMTHLHCLLSQANVLDYEGRFTELRGATDAFLAEVRNAPPGVDATLMALDQAKMLNLRGNADYYGDRKTDALTDYLGAASALQQPGIRRADVRILDQLAFTAYNISATLDELGHEREALAWIDRGVTAADQMAAFEDSPHAWRTVNIVHLQRASTLASLRRFDEAIAEAKANIALRRAIAAKSPHDNLSVRATPVGLRPLGDIEWAAGRRKDACASYAEARALWSQLEQRNGTLGSDLSGEIMLVDKLLKQRCGANPHAR